MTARFDHRGCAISGATPAALQAYERALAASQSWHTGAEEHLADALAQAPDFVMAHVLAAYLRLCSRDPGSVRSARPIAQRLRALRSNDRERLHLAAIETTLDDDYERAKTRLAELLRLEPRDAVALQAAHAFDYATGDAAGLGERVARVLPAWSADLPGYHAVLAMQAFGLEECGEYEAAEESARAALALDPRDARAHHVMAHVFEMTERAPEGERWLSAHAPDWSDGTIVATHGWWHLALFQLAQGRVGAAMPRQAGRPISRVVWPCRVRCRRAVASTCSRRHAFSMSPAPTKASIACRSLKLQKRSSMCGAHARASSAQRVSVVPPARRTRHSSADASIRSATAAERGSRTRAS